MLYGDFTEDWWTRKSQPIPQSNPALDFTEEQPVIGQAPITAAFQEPDQSLTAKDLGIMERALIPQTTGTVPPALPAAPKPTGSSLKDAIMGIAPVVGRIGTEIMGGERTMPGRVGNILAGASQSMLLNENLRKILKQYMSNQGGSQEGFPSDQQFGIEGLAAAGLTPEQLGGIYQAGLTTREKERAWPLNRMKALADVHNTIAMGEYHEAQIPYLKAMLDKMKMETEMMPAKTMAEIMEKKATMGKILADTRRLELESQYKLPAEVQNLQAQAAYSSAGVPLRQQEMWEKSPQGIGYKSFMETMGKNTTDKFMEIPLGNKTIVFNPTTRSIVAEFNTGQKPGEAGKPPQAHSESFARFMTMSDFMPIAEKDILASFPKEEQAKAYQQFKELRDMMKDERTADFAYPALRGVLSNKNKELFDRVLDVYIKNASTNGSWNEAGAKAREIISGRAGGATTSDPDVEKPGKKSILDPSTIANEIEVKGLKTQLEAVDYIVKQYNLSKDTATKFLREKVIPASKVKTGTQPSPTPPPVAESPVVQQQLEVVRSNPITFKKFMQHLTSGLGIPEALSKALPNKKASRLGTLGSMESEY